MSLEVETDLKMQQKLSALTLQPEWDYFLAYLSQIRESERDRLEKADSATDFQFIQGGLKRLRKLAKLRDDLANIRAAAAHDNAENEGE